MRTGRNEARHPRRGLPEARSSGTCCPPQPAVPAYAAARGTQIALDQHGAILAQVARIVHRTMIPSIRSEPSVPVRGLEFVPSKLHARGFQLSCLTCNQSKSCANGSFRLLRQPPVTQRRSISRNPTLHPDTTQTRKFRNELCHGLENEDQQEGLSEGGSSCCVHSAAAVSVRRGRRWPGGQHRRRERPDRLVGTGRDACVPERTRASHRLARRLADHIHDSRGNDAL